MLTAADPYAAGVGAAIRYGRELADVDGAAGVVMTGGVAAGSETLLARAFADIATALRGS